MDAHDLTVENNGQATRPGSECHSIIDLTLANPEAVPHCQDWRILDGEDQTTGSDHVLIEWKWTRPAPEVAKGWKMRGWALRSRLEDEKKEEWPAEKPKLDFLWEQTVGGRDPISMTAPP